MFDPEILGTAVTGLLEGGLPLLDGGFAAGGAVIFSYNAASICF